MDIRDHQYASFVPTHFMTVYQRDGNEHGDKYMEIGNIIKENGKYKVGPSAPVDMEFLTDLVSSIKVENFKALKFKALVPDNVLYYHSEDAEPTIIWEHKSCEKQLYFKKDMGIESGIYKLPNILFATHKDDLYCFRIDAQEGINKDLTLQQLHMMPLPNIYDDCKVCLGGNESKMKKAKCLEEYIKNMEDLFFKTRFNALHHESFGKDTIVVDVMRSKNINNFPYVLAPIKTLKELLHELS